MKRMPGATTEAPALSAHDDSEELFELEELSELYELSELVDLPEASSDVKVSTLPEPS